VRIGGWILTGDNRSIQRKTCPSTTFPTSNRDRTSTSSLRIQPSSAWAMAGSQVRGKWMNLTVTLILL